MDRIEFIKDLTRFLSETQYEVNLKILSRRRARNTEIPKEPPRTSAQMTSNADPTITMQSNRLNFEAKYVR